MKLITYKKITETVVKIAVDSKTAIQNTELFLERFRGFLTGLPRSNENVLRKFNNLKLKFI